MKGITGSMLLLILLGGLVVFLAMQVVGYGVPLPAGTNAAREVKGDKALTSDTNFDVELRQRQQQLEAREAQLNEREAEIIAGEARLQGQQESLSQQQTENEASRQALKDWETWLVTEQEALIGERSRLEEEQKKLAVKLEALEREAARLEALDALLLTQAMYLKTQKEQVLQQKEELRLIEWAYYGVMLVACISLVYHFILMCMLRGQGPEISLSTLFGKRRPNKSPSDFSFHKRNPANLRVSKTTYKTGQTRSRRHTPQTNQIMEYSNGCLTIARSQAPYQSSRFESESDTLDPIRQIRF